MIFRSRVEAFLKIYPPLQGGNGAQGQKGFIVGLICFIPAYKFPEFFDLGW